MNTHAPSPSAIQSMRVQLDHALKVGGTITLITGLRCDVFPKQQQIVLRRPSGKRAPARDDVDKVINSLPTGYKITGRILETRLVRLNYQEPPAPPLVVVRTVTDNGYQQETLL